MNRRRVALHLSFLSRIPNLHLCPTLFPIHYIFFMVKYNMIFYLASMQNIDSSVYEAAEIDGASKFQQFTKITIPLLKPIILLTTIMSTNGTLQLFDEAMNITNGGPGNSTMTISQYIYNLSFVYTPNFGYAATVSYAIVFMVAILAIIQFKLACGKNE